MASGRAGPSRVPQTLHSRLSRRSASPLVASIFMVCGAFGLPQPPRHKRGSNGGKRFAQTKPPADCQTWPNGMYCSCKQWYNGVCACRWASAQQNRRCGAKEGAGGQEGANQCFLWCVVCTCLKSTLHTLLFLCVVSVAVCFVACSARAGCCVLLCICVASRGKTPFH